MGAGAAGWGMGAGTVGWGMGAGATGWGMGAGAVGCSTGVGEYQRLQREVAPVQRGWEESDMKARLGFPRLQSLP